jgi:hypothetical protein
MFLKHFRLLLMFAEKEEADQKVTKNAPAEQRAAHNAPAEQRVSQNAPGEQAKASQNAPAKVSMHVQPAVPSAAGGGGLAVSIKSISRENLSDIGLPSHSEFTSI